MLEWIQKIDFLVLDWIQHHLRGAALDVAMPLVTMLGDGGIFFVLLTLVLLCTKRWRSLGRSLAIALLLGLLFGNLLLKPLVARIRPYDLVQGIELLVEPLSDYSFPSGHTMASFAFASVFWYRRKEVGRWAIAAVVVAVLVAFSRLYLYVHFPTDVLCGAALGWLFGYLAVRLNGWWEKRRAEKQQC